MRMQLNVTVMACAVCVSACDRCGCKLEDGKTRPSVEQAALTVCATCKHTLLTGTSMQTGLGTMQSIGTSSQLPKSM